MRCRYRDDGSLVMAESLWRAVSRRVVEKIRLSIDKLRPLPANSGAVDDATIRRVLGGGLRPGAFFWGSTLSQLPAVLGSQLYWSRCSLALRPRLEALAARFSILPGGSPMALPVVSMENDYLYVKR